MSDAIVFAAYCPDTPVALQVAAHCIEMMQAYHADSDIYVGVQPGCSPRFSALLDQSGLRVQLRHVAPALAVNSDASAFLAALALMKQAGRSYERVWFAHSKGASKATYEEYAFARQGLVEHLWRRRGDAQAAFADPTLGVAGRHMILAQGPLQVERARRLLAMLGLDRHPFLAYTIFQSHYVMRGSVIDAFLRGAPERLFSSHLERDLGFTRYFFESTFPAVVTALGMEPHVWDFDFKDAARVSMDEKTDRRDRAQGHAVLARELRRMRHPGFTPSWSPLLAR